ncbi:MAG: exonuclease domain-containing protein [Planctomycetota bacterium]
MKYIAMDFETANSKRSSVCALGIAIVDGLQVTERSSWLIRPPELCFDPYNVSIHGITVDDVAEKPEFDAIWKDCRHYFDGAQILAHYASFDISVLRHVLDEYGIDYPRLQYFCTYIIAKRAWPKLVNYSLPTVVEHLGIEFKHHDAEEDAAACANVAIRACEEAGTATLEELAARMGITIGQLFPDGYEPCGVRERMPRRNAPKKISQIAKPDLSECDPAHPFFGKTIVFTGTLQSMVREDAMQGVTNYGARCTSAVSKKTDFLVMGDQDFAKLKDGRKSTKMKKAESLIAGGVELEIIAEVEFVKMLTG